MTTKTLSIFYGVDNLPYKDNAREIHFPLVGNTFNGANNVTNIRFYVDRIGGTENVTWLVVSKLPNGQIGNEVLNSNNAVYDEELGEHYIELSLSSYYTTLKGDVYLSLNGYQGGVEVEQDEDTGIYSIYGTPTIQATGVVKIGINYAPQVIPGSHFNTSDLQQILGALSEKANISNVILVFDTLPSDLSGYNDGQLFYIKTLKEYYHKSYGVLVIFDIGFQKARTIIGTETIGNLVISSLNNWVFGRYNDNLLLLKISFAYTPMQHLEYAIYQFGNNGVVKSWINDNGSGDETIASIVSSTPTNEYVTKTYVDTFGKSIELSLNTTTYVLTALLKDASGNTLSTQTIDLPLESTIVNGYYDSDDKALVLVLQSGEEISIPVSDLISGLVSEEDLSTALSELANDLTNALETGQIVPSKSLTANEINAISPDSGDTQETPFILQGTGTANGSSSVDTGTVGKHIQKQGAVYCVNQLVGSLRATFTDSDVTFTKNNDNSITITGTSSATINTWIKLDLNIISGHKYLLTGVVGGSNDTYGISMTNDQANFRCVNGGIIYTANANATANLQVRVFDSGVSFATPVTIKPQLIDLTQWFNGNIPEDLVEHPEHWGLYQDYGNYIAYNTGELVDSNGRYLVCGGRNIWDEQWELGQIYSNGTTGGSLGIRSKNYDICIPSSTIYGRVSSGMTLLIAFYDENKTFVSRLLATNTTCVVPSNARYFRVTTTDTYGTTYLNDITISLYYAGEDYSQYYPYEQPKVYDTGSEQLLSTGVNVNASGEREDAYDYKEPSGLITRRVGSVNLGSIDWTYNSDNGWFYASLSAVKKMSGGSEVPNGLSSMYLPYSRYGLISQTMGFAFRDDTNGLLVKNPNYTDGATFKTAMNGVYLYYELATPTTEQGTPFSENIEINDFGTMGWYSSYTDANTNTLVSVPQGCKIFYPAWYVGFIDTLGQRADIDWTANNVVSQTQLTASATKLYKHHISFTNPALSVPQGFSFDIISTSSLVIARTTSGSVQSWVNLQTVFDNAITFLTRDYFHDIILVNVTGGNEINSIIKLDGTTVMSQTNPSIVLNNFTDTVTPL